MSLRNYQTKSNIPVINNAINMYFDFVYLLFKSIIIFIYY